MFFNPSVMRKTFFPLFAFVLLITVTGCVHHKQLLSYQENLSGVGQVPITKLPDIKIQPNDVLSIKVFSSDMELAAPFNLTPAQQSESFLNVESMQLSGYLVSQEGSIDFPGLGRLNMDGLSISGAKEMLIEKLKQHLQDPVINMRLLNFKVTVSGEVRNPGSFQVINERISVLDALALAGDLTDYADRTDVLLVREKNGVRSLNHLNLQSAAFFQSDYYFLLQNDLLYVKPIKAKSGTVQDQTLKVAPIISALATLGAVLIALFRN